ncbi:MAG: peptidoglycan-binding domain-containing protein [Geminicoccaceae bacterium]
MSFRFRTTLCALFVVAATALVSPASASDSEGRYAVKGMGAVPCKRLSAIVGAKDERTLLLLGWLEGFITSENLRIDGLFDATPWQSTELLAELLTAHCQNRPDQPVYFAVQLMLEAMKATSLKVQSQFEPIDIGEGQSVDIHREIILLAQERLIALGHLGGGADGQFGPKTKAGFEAYQKSVGLEAHGLPDQATLLNLFRGLFGN